MKKDKLFTENGPIYLGSYVELLNNSQKCTVSKILSEKEIELLEYPDKIFLINDEVKPIPKYYKVFSFNGYFIFAENKEEAKIVWDSWVTGNDNGGISYKFSPGDYPKEYKRLKTQAPYPCITDSLDWEYPIYCYLK